MFSKLQYISQGETFSQQLENIQKALDAGCNWIQLRFKNATDVELEATAEQVKILCEHYKAIFIVNDHVELARKVDADGVHLGLQDMSPVLAREILSKDSQGIDASKSDQCDKIIGGTANTLADVLKRVEEKCDYIGLGPLRFTSTKEKLSPVLGFEGFWKICEELKNRNIATPIYAIGGIVADDIDSLMHTGVYGIAVSGIITHHAQAKELVEQLSYSLYAK